MLCKYCTYFVDSSVSKGNRRLCSATTHYKSPDDIACDHFSLARRIPCEKTGETILTSLCLETDNIDCVRCNVGRFVRSSVRLLRHLRNQRRIEMHTEIKEGKPLLKEAIKALNECPFIKVKLSPNVEELEPDELEQTVQKFLDLVELVPPDKEKDLPEIVIDTYNKIVSGEIIIISQKNLTLDGRPIVVSDGDLSFERRKLYIEDQPVIIR